MSFVHINIIIKYGSYFTESLPHCLRKTNCLMVFREIITVL